MIRNGKDSKSVQKQVLDNSNDLLTLKKLYGYKGPYATTSDIPEDELVDDGIYLIGSSVPYRLYKYSEINESFTDLGEYPRAGSQGPQGEPGVAAGFGKPSISVETVEPTEPATASIFASGPNTAKVFAFQFEIPKGAKGDKGDTGDTGPQGEPGEDGTDGANGITPHIDSTTGDWFIGNVDTGVHAQGPAGEAGTDGVTPHIGANGNWFIGETDTGVHAEGPQGPQGVGAYTAGTGIDITSDVVSIAPNYQVDKTYINEFVGGSIWAKTSNYDTYDGTDNLAGMTQYDKTTLTQIMKKPTYNAVTLYTAEEMAQSSVNHGADAPAYKMTFDDGTNTAIYTFPRTKSGDVAVTSEIPTVGGTNDGTNWTSITLGSDTYAIPQGGSGSSEIGVISISSIPSTENPVYLTSEQAAELAKTECYIYYSGQVTPSVLLKRVYHYDNLSDPTTPSYLDQFRYIYIINDGTNGKNIKFTQWNGQVRWDATEQKYKFTVTSLGNDCKTYSQSYLDSVIPTVSGTNDGTNWTTLTIGSDTYGIGGGGGTPANMVTTDTNQNITGVKTFKSTDPSNTLATEISNAQVVVRATGQFSNLSASGLLINESSDGSSYNTDLIYHHYTNGSSFRNYRIIFSNDTSSTIEGTYTFDHTKTGTVAVTSEIPTATSDLTNDSGFITSSSLPDMTNYYTKTEINTNYYDRTDVDDIVDNVAADIPEIFTNQPNPTTALTSLSINNTNYSIPSAASSSSTSTVTPTTSAFVTGTTKTTETLTFTYSDNTTANITIVTSVTDNTSNAMTGATVSTTTTTTLS